MCALSHSKIIEIKKLNSHKQQHVQTIFDASKRILQMCNTFTEKKISLDPSSNLFTIELRTTFFYRIKDVFTGFQI